MTRGEKELFGAPTCCRAVTDQGSSRAAGQQGTVEDLVHTRGAKFLRLASLAAYLAASAVGMWDVRADADPKKEMRLPIRPN